MCGIAGISGKIITKHLDVLNDLGSMLCYRGEHATGIAFNNDMGLQIKKAPISPKDIDFVSVLAFEEGLQEKIIFHNRFFTSGNPKENKNNHPFRGSTFALAHNGVLTGYRMVAMQNGIKLTDDEPETDSYVLVRLIDKFLAEGLSFEEAIAKTCNLFLGSSLCLEILTDNNDLYLVRGDTYSFDLFEIGDNEYIYASSPTGKYNANADESITNVIFNYLQKNVFSLFKEDSDIEFRMKKINVPKYSIIKIDYDGKLQSITQYSEEKNSYSSLGKYCGSYSYSNYFGNMQKNLFGEDVPLDEALGNVSVSKEKDDESERDAYEEYVYEWCAENGIDYEFFDFDDDTQDLLPLSFEKWKEVNKKVEKTMNANEVTLKALEFIKKMYPKSNKKGLEKLDYVSSAFLRENNLPFPIVSDDTNFNNANHPFTIFIERHLKQLSGLDKLTNLSQFLAEKFAESYSKQEIMSWMAPYLSEKLEKFTDDFWRNFEKFYK